MVGYVAGSVTAKIELDTTDFDKKVEALKGKVDDLKVTLQKNGLADVSKQIKKYEEALEGQKTTIAELTDRINDYKTQLKALREGHNQNVKSIKDEVKQLNSESKAYDNATKSAKKFEKVKRNTSKNNKSFVPVGTTEWDIMEQKAARASNKAIQFQNSMYRLAKAIKLYNNSISASQRRTESFMQEMDKFVIRSELQAQKFSEFTGTKSTGRTVFLDNLNLPNIRAATTAMDTFNRTLKSTRVNYKALESASKPFNVSSTQLSQATQALTTFNRMLKSTELNWRKLNSLPKQNVFNPSSTQLSQAAQALNTFNRGLKSTELNWRKLNSMADIFDPVISDMIRAGQSFVNLENKYMEMAEAASKAKESISGYAPVAEKTFAAATQGAERYREKIRQMSDELRKMYLEQEKYYASVGAMSWKYWKQVRNSTIGNNKEWNSNGTWQTAQFKAQTVGLQDYYQNINKVTTALVKLKKEQQSLKLDTKAYSTTNFEKAGRALRAMNKELERNILLEKRRRSATFLSDSKAYSNANFQKASQGLALLNKQQETNIKNLKDTGQWAMKSGRGITSFNNGFVQTAHSGRILSNTLYQVRGALLSLKMIFTAMGGMALWGFATEIAEGIKTTFTAKNEMEEQLKANAKVGASGLQTFNRELDTTISKFKKVNKYALGETVSSLGLEFELNTGQMSKAMDIVAMIQSEYVRAGRTQEEAALAVKDILQGEFQRLSRETGVGKEELLAYGWSGDTKDIDSILKAVKKAGEDRNWDLFAAKATSLNDVIQITKSRFEEFGADLLQSISPMIVGAFNTLAGGLDGLKKAFDGLGSFGKNTVFATMATGIAGLIGTGLPMVTKGMGLADIATIGWTKSLGTAIFNLNKATVAQHGFRKALAEVITGTKASDLANVRSTKAIMGRILGVKQSVLAEHSYLTAMVHSKGVLMNHTGATNIAKVSSMGLAQKVAYLTGNMKLQEAQALSNGKAILKTATSWKVLRTAMLGVIGIGVIAWYSSMATWADTVRKNIEGLNEVIDNGDSMLKDAQSTVSDYEKSLAKLTKGTKEYAKAENNLKVAKYNEIDIRNANTLAKQYKKQNKQMEEYAKLRHQTQMARTYELAGIDQTKAFERASGWERRVRAGEQNWIDSMAIYNDRLYKSNQHLNEHVNLMKQANVPEEKRLKYIDEYATKAEEVAENWKKFNQGDMSALAYAILGELQLQWIDLWNDGDFIIFWGKVQQTWKELLPTLQALYKALLDFGRTALKFFSTDVGRWIGTIGAFGIGVGVVVSKLSKWITGNNIIIEGLKKLGTSLKDRIKDWDIFGKKAEEANKKSTGGITPEGKVEKAPTTRGEWWQDTKGKIYQDATKYARAAVAIAAGMLLISEAILMLNVPMWSLSQTGKYFKSVEPHIRDGIDGLRLIAPVMEILLPPVVALTYILAKYEGAKASTILKGAGRAFVGIAVGIGLVAEAVAMLAAPMVAIAALGWVNDLLGDSVDKGIHAIEQMGDAVMALVPVVPVFVAAMVLGDIAISTAGAGLLAIVAGIALGMLGVSAAILTLAEPLFAIGVLGAVFTDLSAVKKGTEAIKACAEAMKYVEEATSVMMLVKWEVLATNIADVIAQLMGHNLGEDLVKLTEEGGFLDQMEKFAKGFNNKSFTPIDPEKATAFKTVADSLGALNDALESAKNAIANIPAEFKNGGNGQPILSYDMNTDSTAVTGTTDTEGYFDQLKQPIEDLAKFMDWFNKIDIPEVDSDRVANLTSTASMVEQINNAVEKVKSTMGNIALGNIATNMAQTTGGGGGLGALAALNPLTAFGMGVSTGGSGEYKSSIGSQLYEMEMVLTDLSTFNSNVANIGGGNGGGAFTDGGNAEALSSMVTAVSEAINQLNSTLNQAVPQITANATAIGSGIQNGIKLGMGNLTQLVVPPLVVAMNAMKANAYTYGKGVGDKGKQGIRESFKVAEIIDAELRHALWVMDSKKQHFYNKGYQLGQASAQGVQDGDDMHSPGIISRTFMQEMSYIDQTFDEAIRTAPQKAYTLGETLATNFNPSLGLGGLSVDELGQFQTGLNQVSSMANSTNMQTTTAFNTMNTNVATDMQGMSTSVNTAYTSIQQNTTSRYGQLVNTTRTSLNTMQSQTTRNINAIKTSWKGMQNALIASAENIRNETSSKIRSLESNMASFWRKVQNPATLMGSAGSINTQHSIRRRGNPIKTPHLGFAGSMKTGRKATGISNKFKSTKSTTDPSVFVPLLKLFGSAMQGHYAGGWSFDWSKDIQNSLLKWHTHFGEIYDDVLTVGKFENDDFPVRGMASIAKKYIYDAISRTHYVGYFDSRYGDDPVAAWNAGGFNCWDGTNIVLALARAFGFEGGRVHGSWDGIPHVWARIKGLGDIDATAIQGGYGFTASKVRGAGSLNSRKSSSDNFGNTTNIGDVNVNVTIEGNVDNAEETGRRIGEEASKTVLDILKRSPATGL